MASTEDSNLAQLKGQKILGVAPNELSAPIYLVLEPTRRCNLECLHCGVDSRYSDAGPDVTGDELTVAEIGRLADQCRNMGVARILLSGGEPFMRKDIFHIIDAIRQRGIGCCVATNGTLLDSASCERLEKLGVDWVEMSLFGPDRQSNDEFCGIDGAFDRILPAIKALLATRVPLRVNLVCTKLTFPRLSETISFLQELGVKEAFLGVLRHAGRARTNESTLAYSPAEFSEVLLDIDAMSKEARSRRKRDFRLRFTGTESVHHYLKSVNFLPHCGAGRLFCSISSTGDMMPCPYFCQDEGFVVGNIGESGLEELWRDSPILGEFRRGDIPGCAGCGERTCVGGCRLESYRKYGDIRTGEDPYCKREMVAAIRTSLTAQV
jgi:radical SAM protein with 4Fe4S-binding SPASM domain